MYEWDRENLSLDLKRIYLVAVTTPIKGTPGLSIFTHLHTQGFVDIRPSLNTGGPTKPTEHLAMEELGKGVTVNSPPGPSPFKLLAGPDPPAACPTPLDEINKLNERTRSAVRPQKAPPAFALENQTPSGQVRPQILPREVRKDHPVRICSRSLIHCGAYRFGLSQ